MGVEHLTFGIVLETDLMGFRVTESIMLLNSLTLLHCHDWLTQY